MNTPTIYTATPADLSPPVQTDSFCVDLVLATDYQKLKDEFKQLAAENVALKSKGRELLSEACAVYVRLNKLVDPAIGNFVDGQTLQEFQFVLDAKTPASDRIVAGIKADGRVEGAHFVANRILAALDAGFIEGAAKSAADVARMILASTKFMADAPEGDFDRSFADGILGDIAKQLREGDNHD